MKQVDAIEFVEEPIPEWQKQESLKRFAEMEANQGSLVSEESFFKSLDEDEQV